MNTYIRKLTPIVGLAVIGTLPSTAFAGDQGTKSVVVQTEVNFDEMPVITDAVYQAALVEAAARTLDENKDWFQVTYREATTAPVTVNIENNAESRYLDLENGERVELDVETKDVLIQVQKINFEMGTGAKPADANSFVAGKLVLPES